MISDGLTDRQTDICNSRVAFATETLMGLFQRAIFHHRFGMHLLIVFTHFMSLIYAIKTQDDCQIIRSGTSKPEICDYDRKHNIKKGCKRPNVSSLLYSVFVFLGIIIKLIFRVLMEI